MKLNSLVDMRGRLGDAKTRFAPFTGGPAENSRDAAHG